ncbi:hypothetical protein B0H67DRAFT_553679 [Lasiosphaeris hirsuta]|uniref:Uncharacterized protein n=1 Tax=Lasiosphaeris hirsuta TaxID=260670 RepID=A0AA40AFV2_9PEZI|nr:hypothetical protein B0H67DRAFT_553679 [Lasiosphaeris hirsuta]
METPQQDEQCTGFDWMGLDDTSEAFSHFLDQSMTPFDFGDAGYTACANIGGEILEVTAPSDLCGYISVKGGYEDSIDSLLARSQRPFGGRATFSLKIEDPQPGLDEAKIPGHACRLGPMKGRGSLNHRWPLTRYWLDTGKDDASSHAGYCAVFSFVREQTVFQVMRLQLFKKTTDGAGAVNTVEFSDNEDADPREATVNLTLGGPMRFSCRCSGLDLKDKSPSVEWSVKEEALMMMETSVLPDTKFILKLYEDGRAVAVSRPPEPKAVLGEEGRTERHCLPWEVRHRRFWDTTFRHNVRLSSKKPTVIMAAFKLASAQGGAEIATKIPILTDEMVMRIAGLSPEYDSASNAMWNSFFSSLLLVGRSAKPSFFYERQLGLIQRCLERVLSAHHVCFMVGELECGVDIWPHVPGSAVSARQLFWIVRFLAEVLDQLQQLDRAEADAKAAMAYYKNEIRLHMLRTARFAIFAARNSRELEENKSWWDWSPIKDAQPEQHRLKRYEEAEDEYSCFYYAPIIWYTLKTLQHLQLNSDRDEMIALLADNLKSVVEGLSAVGDNRGSNGNSSTFCAHKWLHYYALSDLIQTADQVPSSNTRTPEEDSSISLKLDEAEKKAERWRLSLNKALKCRVLSGEAYTLQDEICDRLILSLTKKGRVGTITMQGSGDLTLLQTQHLVKQHISSRSPTMIINPGKLTRRNVGRFVPPVASPWELHALCHHVDFLDFPSMQGEAPNRAIQDCLQFLCADQSIIPTWERSTVDSLAGWFSLEPTCVIATTMLERLVTIQVDHHGKTRCQKNGHDHDPHTPCCDDPKGGDSAGVIATVTDADADSVRSVGDLALIAQEHAAQAKIPSLRFGRVSKTFRQYSPYFGQAVLSHSKQLLGMLTSLGVNDVHYRHDAGTHELELKHADTPLGSATATVSGDIKTLAEAARLSGGVPSPIDWALYKFPDTDHPDSFLHSLDDSPHRFTETELNRIELRPRLAKHLAIATGSKAREYTLENIGNTMLPSVCSKVSIIDLMSPAFFMNQDTEKAGLIGNPVITGRICPTNFLTKPCGDNPMTSIPFYADFLDEALCEGNYIPAKYNRELKDLWSNHDDMERKMTDKIAVKHEREELQKRLLVKLSDSLVDQQVQCRYFFIQDWDIDEKNGAGLVGPFVYIWHNELLDAFEDHLGSTSTFTHNSTETTWTASLTVLHWSILPFKNEKSGHVHRFPADDPLPQRRKARQQPSSAAAKETQQHWITEKAEPTTILMTTNALGDFTKCSIVSKMLPECAIYRFADTATEIWTMFSNQPQTGRCLAFLHLVGLVCEATSAHYEEIMRVLDDNSRYTKSTLEYDFSWTQQREAIGRLKYYLWQLGVVQLFHNNVSECVGQIKALEQVLTAQGPGRRHEVLQDLARSELELFRRRFGRLRTICKNIEYKVDYLTRVRDGISSICGLQDSRTSIKQDDHIRILTWITIGYLPLSFVTTIFAVPATQNVVADGLGLGIFLGAMLGFFFATVLLANLLGPMVKAYEKWRKDYLRHKDEAHIDGSKSEGAET